MFFPPLPSDREGGRRKISLFLEAIRDREGMKKRGGEGRGHRYEEDHQRLNIFTCMIFLFPRCDWPSSFVSSFLFFFFFLATRREGDAPPLDGCFHPVGWGEQTMPAS